MSPTQKRIASADAHEVIIQNVLHLLEEKKIKQIELATFLNIDSSTISRWKKSETKINVDQLKAIADFFDVSVEQLIRTEKERIALHQPSKEGEKPYIPQQIIQFRVFDLVFENPYMVLFILIGFAIFNVVYAFSIQGHDVNLMYFIMASPVAAYFTTSYFLITKKTYIINYLDDIFYRMEDVKNPYFFHTIFLTAIGMVGYFIYLLIIVRHLQRLDMNQDIYALLVLALLLGFIFSVPLFFSNRKKFKQEIYHHELDHYKDHLKLLMISLFQLSFLFIYELLGVPTNVTLWALGSFIFIINSAAFYLVSKALSRYKLIYEEHGRGRHEMYPTKKS